MSSQHPPCGRKRLTLVRWEINSSIIQMRGKLIYTIPFPPSTFLPGLEPFNNRQSTWSLLWCMRGPIWEREGALWQMGPIGDYCKEAWYENRFQHFITLIVPALAVWFWWQRWFLDTLIHEWLCTWCTSVRLSLALAYSQGRTSRHEIFFIRNDLRLFHWGEVVTCKSPFTLNLYKLNLFVLSSH